MSDYVRYLDTAASVIENLNDPPLRAKDLSAAASELRRLEAENAELKARTAVVCGECGGSGQFVYPRGTSNCPECNGTGAVIKEASDG